jgi:hypothetical protein
MIVMDELKSLKIFRFVQQQGFPEIDEATSVGKFRALMFQPRLLGVLAFGGIVFQFAPLFLALSALLWWNVLLPQYNPFDALYNALIAGPKELPRLGSAPPPRRAAQAMAGTIMLGAGATLLGGWPVASWILQGLFVMSGVLLRRKFCVGSYFYHLVKGDIACANRTLP